MAKANVMEATAVGVNEKGEKGFWTKTGEFFTEDTPHFFVDTVPTFFTRGFGKFQLDIESNSLKLYY